MDRVGNPLEWGYVDKAMLSILFQMLVYGVLVLYGYLAHIFPMLYPAYFSPTAFSVIIRINIAFLLFFGIILAIALRTRRTNPDSRWIAYTTAVAITAQDALFLCMIGHTTNPQTLLILFLLLFIGLLLFDYYYSLCVVVTWFLIHGFHIVEEQFRLIPYAWALIEPPFKNGIIDNVWLIWNLGGGFFLIAVMIFMLGYILYRWRKREAQVVEMTALLKRMFGRYLSTEVMSSIIENPSALELGGERREVTIMMTDLRGFTALSERLEPERVVQMLNAYFEVMVDVVIQYNGTINEIIGDALLVVFGAPQEMQDRAQRAVACAIAMQNAMAKVNEENHAHGLPELEMGIGLNEAEVIVGNIGSSKRSNYTAIGSGVNMASRIESYTIGGQVLISESVKREAGEILRIDDKKEVMPKGAETAIIVYEVGGIGGQYNLALEEKEPVMVTLMRQIPLQFSILGGKHVSRKGFPGRVIRLSRKSAEIELKESFEILTNLKMNLKSVTEELTAKNFYGKIIEPVGESAQTQMVRFTSVPPEIDSYFQAHLQYATKKSNE